MNKAKRILSFALCLVMMLTLMPFSVFADGTHSVTVKYVYADGLKVSGQQVYEPWVATYSDGSAVNETVSLPQAVGYAPISDLSISGDITAQFTADGTAIELTSAGITGDVVVTVTYTAAKNVYKVEYYQQHVYDDGYDLAETVTVNDKYTEEKVAVEDKGYTGFYMLPYDEDVTVAADGTTVIKVYYDRNYYLVTFDYAGGFDGPDPIYARYGSRIDASTITAPTKPGYTFDGWNNLPATVPVGSATATANWKRTSDTAKVTYVIWGENANDEDYSYLMSYNEFEEIDTQPTFAMPSDGKYLTCGKDAHTHTNSVAPSGCYALTCDKEVHTHSDSCIKCTHIDDYKCYGGTSVFTGDIINYFNKVYSYEPKLTVESGYIYKFQCDGNNNHADNFNGEYLYLNGTWYKGNFSHGNAVASFKSDKSSHDYASHTLPWNHDNVYKYKANITNCTHKTHTDACYVCGKTPHTHSAIPGSCYTLTCTKEAHSHTSACYKSIDTSLYTLRKADNVTVAADGSTVVNVYLDRNDYTITFKNGSSTVKTVTRKWGQSLADIWPIVGTDKTYNNGERWYPEDSNTYGNVLVYIDIMPSESFTLSVNTKTYDTKTMNYRVEVLPGESGTTYSGKTFKLYKTVSAKYNYITEAEDFINLTGFTKWKSDPAFKGGRIENNNKADFYYTRNSYNLIFNNGIDNVDTFTVPYEKPLKDVNEAKSVDPERPSYISSQYVFDGWYLNPEGTGDKVDLNTTTIKMPADNLVLYAKWVPKTYIVNFANTKDDTAPDSLGTIKEGYNTYIDRAEYNTIRNKAGNGARTFIGWFYMENGVEKAFDPTSMPVTKDMDLYAKWSSTVVLPYNVYFKLKNGPEIGEAISGKALEDSTRTFDAKIGNELFSGYKTGYYPEVNSHSIVITDGESNDFTFYYVYKEKVNYTVEYRNALTGEPMPGVDTKHGETSSAVVTETYVPIKGYIPDAAQKTLILTANDEDNVIVFYYTKNLDSAMVSINHFLMQGVDHTKRVTAATSEKPGKVGETVNAAANNYAGYTFAYAEVIVGGTTETAGASVSDILTNDGIIINFYYNENIATYEYKVVGKGGTVNGEASVTENVPVMTGRAAGAAAAALEGYRIVGWFDNEDCTVSATDCSINGNKLTPDKVGGVYCSHDYFVKVVPSSLYNRTIVVDYGLPVSFTVDDYAIGGLGVTAPVALITGTTTNNTCSAKSVSLKYGKAELSDTSIIYTPAKFVNGIDKFVYSVKDGSDYRFAQVTVIPATTVYYEDTTVGSINYADGTGSGESGKWTSVGTTKTTNQHLDIANVNNLSVAFDEANVFGYDQAYENCTTYSMGTAHKVTVSAADANAWPTAQFTFTGTGFDIISLTDSKSGTIVVNVAGDGFNKNWIVDNYYGYGLENAGYNVYKWVYVDEGHGWRMNEATYCADAAEVAQIIGTDYNPDTYEFKIPADTSKAVYEVERTFDWVTKGDADNAIYQVPVIRSGELAYGTYTVTVKVMYSSAFDRAKADSYSFTLDAIRIYNPMGNDEAAKAAYKEAHEFNPEFINIRSQLVEQNSLGVGETNGIAYIDGILEQDNSSIGLYKTDGPNHEVYLQKNNAVAFKLNAKNVDKIMLGMKLVDGNSATVDVNGKTYAVKSTTDMYYDITEAVMGQETIAITCTDGIVSLTNLKVTHTAPSKVSFTSVSPDNVLKAKSMMCAAILANVPVEVIPFEPTVSVDVVDKATVGDELTVKVTTSDDVAYITVNGEKVETHDADFVWTYTMTADAEGEMAIEVKAYNADGEVAETAWNASVAVEAAPVPDEPEQSGIQKLVKDIGNALKNFFGKLFGR